MTNGKQDSANDKFARMLAVLSLIIAIVSTGVQYYQQRAAQRLQQEQFATLQKEELKIKLNPYTDGLVKFTRANLGQLGTVVQVPWEITFSNTASRKLSVVKYSITSGESSQSMYYSDIAGGIFDGNQKAIDLPLVLDSGESKTYFVFVGLLVSPHAYKVLSEIKKEPLTVREASLELAKSGTDFYGNSVEYREFEGGGHVITLPAHNRKTQRFWFQATSGLGNTYSATAAMYDQQER